MTRGRLTAVDRDSLGWLFGFIRPQRGALLALLLLSVATSTLVLVQPYLTKLLIDDGLIPGDYNRVVTLVGLMFGLGLLATLASGVNRYYYTRVSGRILFALRETVYRHLQTLSPAFYSRNRTGDVMSRLDGDVAEIQRFAVDSLFTAVSALLGLVGTLGFMLLLSPRLTLVLLAVIPLQWVYLRFMRERVQRRTRALRERSADLSAFLVETLPAMKFIQGAAAEAREAKRLGGLNRHYLDNLLQLQLTQFATSAVPSTLTSLARAVVLLTGGYWVVGGDMALGSLIAFGTYLGMATGPVQGLLGLYMSLHRVQVCLQRVRQLMDARPSVSASGGRPLPQPRRGQIDFESVSFTYPDSEGQILTDASVTLPAGARVGISSPSGSGKSTVLDLLLRHYDPDAGRILVDGCDLRDLDLGEWRRSIALVEQDVVLFRASLLDNIRYGHPDASEAAVRDAVARVHLQSLVQRLPRGLDTPLGERGMSLSGGERQRVAIARALLQNPSLVLLDEATSALEEPLERDILATVDELFGDRTRLLVSHRPAVLADCEIQLQLAGGRLRCLRGLAAAEGA